jgi:hypothetical protein
MTVMENHPIENIPENPVADAKDRLRDEGIVVGPDRYGNWFVPTGKHEVTGWRPGDPVEGRVLVRNSGALAGGPYSMRWGWIEGRWVENVEGIGCDEPDGEPLPFIY